MDSEGSFNTPRRRGSAFAWMATAVLLAFLSGLVIMAVAARRYRWFDTPVATRPVPARTVATIAPAPDLATLNARETVLSAQLADLEARTADVGVQSRSASGYATRAEGMMVTFAARRALDRGVQLGYLEDQLRLRFGTSQPRAVTTVIAAARQPVTLEDLRQGLDTITPDLVTGTTRNGWIAGLRRELSGLVTLRHAGTPSPRPNDRIERAKRLLGDGQVEAALAEVVRLPGVTSAQNWIAAARRYVAARQALDVIETAAIIGEAQEPAPVASPLAAPGEVAGPTADPTPVPSPTPNATPTSTSTTAGHRRR